MSHVFYLRPIDPPAAVDDVLAMAAQSQGCFNLHRVDWAVSFLEAEGRRMLCWYRAPDAEAARMALRELGSNMNAVWSGSVSGEPSRVEINTVVEFPANPSSEAARREALDACGATVACSIESRDGRQTVYLLHSEDLSRLRDELGAAGQTPELVWACSAIHPTPA